MEDIDHLKFKSVYEVGDSLLSDQLEANIVCWLDWCFLGIGAFFNNTIPSSGAYGGNNNKLFAVSRPGETEGTIWKGFRKDWVWHTGIYYHTQPIQISGVYVNGNLTTSGYTINYPDGEVTFSSPQSGTITCEYSYKLVQIYPSSSAHWFKEIQYNSFRSDDSHLNLSSSGEKSIFSKNNIQLPAIVVEAVPFTQRRPHSIGNSMAITTQVVDLHILAEDDWHKKQLHDILTYQYQKRILAFDKNDFLSSPYPPLNPYGDINPSGELHYPNWAKPTTESGLGFFWKQLRVENTSSIPATESPSIYTCKVRWEVESDV